MTEFCYDCGDPTQIYDDEPSIYCPECEDGPLCGDCLQDHNLIHSENPNFVKENE